MLSERSKRIAYWLAIASFGLASAWFFVVMWSPFFSKEKDLVPTGYGVIPGTWTLIAFAIAAIGLFLGRGLHLRVSAPLAVVILSGAIGFFLWKFSPTPWTHPAPAEAIVLLGASLLPSLMFGWLVGYGRRVRRAASAIPN